jgi:GNAT superfamily N-acetyltransferase
MTRLEKQTAASKAGLDQGGAFSIRPGNRADIRACHDLLWAAVTDLGARQGRPFEGSADDWWVEGASLHEFLAEHSAEWWVAQAAGSRELTGYARSTERAGMLELTEFFVRPGNQSRGAGKALLERVFPPGRGKVRSIVATTDPRALSLYYRAGVVARFSYLSLAGAPRAAEPDQLSASPIDDDPALLDEVARVEQAVLGYPRSPAELRWLLGRREGYLFWRDGAVTGFAFVSKAGSGPIAALEPADLPDILLHVEGRAHALGVQKLELEVPGLNATAVRHLLDRGFRIDPWVNVFMSDQPFGRFDRFIGFSPPIFL